MKRFSIALSIIFYASSIFSMEAPQKIEPIFTIVAHQAGNINSSCTTTAEFLTKGRPLSQIIYTLQGGKHVAPAICDIGPAQHLNKCFIGRITHLEDIGSESTPNAEMPLHHLLAFAISNLKELHKKQSTTDFIEDKNLYIDAFLNPQNPIIRIYELFGFKKVDSGRSGKDIYLLSPTETDAQYSGFLLPPSSITIDEKPELKLEPTTEEKYWQKFWDDRNEEIEAFYKQTPSTDIQKLLDEKGKRTRAGAPKKSTPSHLPVIDPSELPTPIPAAANPADVTMQATDSSSSSEEETPAKPVPTISKEELRKTALAKLRAREGQKVRLPRAELEAMVVKTGLAPIRDISKKTSSKTP